MSVDSLNKQIADLRKVLDTQGDIADYLWEENKEFEDEIVDLKEKLAESYKSDKKEFKRTQYLANACGNYQRRIEQLEKLHDKWKIKAKELEGRLSAIQELLKNRPRRTKGKFGFVFHWKSGLVATEKDIEDFLKALDKRLGLVGEEQ